MVDTEVRNQAHPLLTSTDLVGDATVQFLTPHSEVDNPNGLTEQQERENAVQSATRAPIERAFGQFTKKFTAWKAPWRHGHDELNPTLWEMCAVWNCCQYSEDHKEKDTAAQNHPLFAQRLFDLDLYQSRVSAAQASIPSEWGNKFMSDSSVDDVEDVPESFDFLPSVFLPLIIVGTTHGADVEFLLKDGRRMSAQSIADQVEPLDPELEGTICCSADVASTHLSPVGSYYLEKVIGLGSCQFGCVAAHVFKDVILLDCRPEHLAPIIRASAIDYVRNKPAMFNSLEEIAPWVTEMENPDTYGDDRTWSALIQIFNLKVLNFEWNRGKINPDGTSNDLFCGWFEYLPPPSVQTVNGPPSDIALSYARTLHYGYLSYPSVSPPISGRFEVTNDLSLLRSLRNEGPQAVIVDDAELTRPTLAIAVQGALDMTGGRTQTLDFATLRNSPIGSRTNSPARYRVKDFVN